MTEVEFRGIKKIVVLEELGYSSEEAFFEAVIEGVEPDVPVIVLWADGVVFRHTPLSIDLEEFAKRYADEGVIYWSVVMYAKKERYEEEKRVGMHTIKITKPTSTALMDVAKELSKRFEQLPQKRGYKLKKLRESLT